MPMASQFRLRNKALSAVKSEAIDYSQIQYKLALDSLGQHSPNRHGKNEHTEKSTSCWQQLQRCADFLCPQTNGLFDYRVRQ